MVTIREVKTMKAAEIPVGITRRQLYPELYSTHLTGLEQKLLLGGSISREDTEGTLMSNEEIFQSDETLRIHPSGSLSVEQITEERRNKFIEGYFPILHLPTMAERGYKHRVFLPEVINGRIRPVFRIQLITDKGTVVRERDIIDEVINGFPPDYQRYFQLRIDEESGELLLERVLEREPQATTV